LAKYFPITSLGKHQALVTKVCFIRQRCMASTPTQEFLRAVLILNVGTVTI
jgi:hypothetical protein